MKQISPRHSKIYCIHIAEWQGITLEIGYCPQWCSDMDHIEIRSKDSTPIPLTGTGYKSVFIASIETDITCDPARYVLDALDHAATSSEWQNQAADAVQLSLF
ncbi:MAG: hypothetical protein ABJN40_07325 [Sneathiella sp.]